MPVFQLSTVLTGDLGEIYQFHTDTQNLALIQPPGFRLARCVLPPLMAPGAVVDLTVKFLGVPQHWKVCLEKLDAPRGKPGRARVVDRALVGPFSFWSHQHLFEEVPEGVRMTDVVDFDPPGGRLGWLLLPGCYAALGLIFAFRHAATRKIWPRG
jgi:ligand-binding SRPBCC domain-containing protein